MLTSILATFPLAISCQITTMVTFQMEFVPELNWIEAGYYYNGSEVGNPFVCRQKSLSNPKVWTLDCEHPEIDESFQLELPIVQKGDVFSIYLTKSNEKSREELLPCFIKN